MPVSVIQVSEHAKAAAADPTPRAPVLDPREDLFVAFVGVSEVLAGLAHEVRAASGQTSPHWAIKHQGPKHVLDARLTRCISWSGYGLHLPLGLCTKVLVNRQLHDHDAATIGACLGR